MVMLAPADVYSELTTESVATLLRTKRRFGSLSRYGNAKFIIPSNSDVVLESLSPEIFAYVKAAQKHASYIAENAMDLFLVPFLTHGRYAIANGSTVERFVTVRWAGIESSWTAEDFSEWLAVRASWLVDNVPHTGLGQDTYGRDCVEVVLPYSDNPNGSLFIEAYNKARKAAMQRELSHSFNVTQYNRFPYAQRWRDSSVAVTEFVNVATASFAVNYSHAVDRARPTSAEINQERIALVADLADAARSVDVQRKRVSLENFSKYWTTLKQGIASRVDKDEVRASFNTVPILPAGSKSSRTWGIEIETVQAQLTDRPRGWDQRHDGSLESMSGGDCTYDYCNCECDDCCDGEHDGCYVGDDSSCAEFVSPVLSHFNSDGLRQLCNDIGDAPCNTSPGIHVHVGADDLSTQDVARLVRTYSIVSPFLVELTRREVFGYCKDISTSNVAHWLSVARDTSRGSSKLTVSQAVSNQPDDRYRDLNTQAFNAHGTIEFRAMGPVYDYALLVRWAWLCRELVNISKLDLPDSLWRNVTSMADILNIVYQYGSETSDTVMSPFESTNVLDLGVESDDEATND